ncbi:MAG: lmo0937 family membrane protein [Candidatus Sulfotelmatobacter sp.]
MKLDLFRKISLALVILWACSFLVFHVASVLIHMLLVVAVLFYVGYLVRDTSTT